MKTALLTGGVATLLILTCAGFAPNEAPSLTPLPPARLDFQIQPVPGTRVAPTVTQRFPMVIVEVDPARFPMPVTQGRVGNYPIPVIPPDGINYVPLPPNTSPVPRVVSYHQVPAAPGK
jgi:hypothetical protein